MTTSDFDARAATWDDDPTKVERAQAVADAIVRHVSLTGAMNAMEFGCGTGLLSFMLRPRLGRITLALTENAHRLDTRVNPNRTRRGPP